MKIGPLRVCSTEDLRREGLRRQSPGHVGDLAQPYRTRGALVALAPHEPCGVTGCGPVDMSAPGLPIECVTRRTYNARSEPRDVDGCHGISTLGRDGLRTWKPKHEP